MSHVRITDEIADDPSLKDLKGLKADSKRSQSCLKKAVDSQSGRRMPAEGGLTARHGEGTRLAEHPTGEDTGEVLRIRIFESFCC
jgi:hypothetical protein